MKPKRVLIAAGGSGGHLIPAQQLAELLEKNHGCSIVFAGYKLEKSPYFDRTRFQYKEITSAPLSSNPFRLFFALARGFFSAVKLLLVVRPSVVVGFGSYHTVPVLFAAALLRKRFILYEANRIIGKVNRLFYSCAKVMAIQLPLLDRKIRKVVEVPLFPWIHTAVPEKKEALKQFGFTETRSTILVFGGSQGASFLNEMVPLVLEGRDDVQVIHITGRAEANK